MEDWKRNGIQPRAWLPVALAVWLATGCDGARSPEEQAPLAAREVSQPEGWADELAMAVPTDLNPDPNVLEIELEARVADVEILPGNDEPKRDDGQSPG